MVFTLEKVVPWGRSYREYVDMFALSQKELCSHILGCGDGPAGFNAELTARGGQCISVDPIYAFDATQIRQRIDETYDTVITQVRQNQKGFVWNIIPSVEKLGEIRMAAMTTFLADYAAEQRSGRYVAAALPDLPFRDQKFDLVLCSHLLFLYGAQLSAEFHFQALREMLRVAAELRVFPLLALDGKDSPYLDDVKLVFASQGFVIEQKMVAYEFQRGGNQMLSIKHR